MPIDRGFETTRDDPTHGIYTVGGGGAAGGSGGWQIPPSFTYLGTTTSTITLYTYPTTYTSRTATYDWTRNGYISVSNSSTTFTPSEWMTELHVPAGTPGPARLEPAPVPAYPYHPPREPRPTQTRDDRVRATDRATELLLSLLPPDQRETYQLQGVFEIIGSEGTVYRINRGTSGNVEWITPEGEVGGRLCAHPTMAESWLPEQDVALSQMLALTTDERAWLRVANVHRGSRPPVTL
jgi:hypothetical protein